MRITSGNTTIDYSITDHGSFCQTVKSPMGVLRRTTPDVQKFIGWMTRPTNLEQSQISVMQMAKWWEYKQPYVISGRFDFVHYYAICAHKLAILKPVEKVSKYKQFINKIACSLGIH